jgi:F-type H+-transporting ATPase subunit b
MLIDWFTVIAQVINFLILVWLMKRFLYQPILDAIDAREKRIAATLANAAAQQAEAATERHEFQHKNEEFARQRAALFNKATQEAQAEHQRLLDEARQDAKVLLLKRQETLRDDARRLNRTIQQRTQQEVFAIARKVLGDLAGATLEERLGEVFTMRLRQLDEPTKSVLAAALNSATAPASVRSAFNLPAAQRTTIQNVLNEIFAAEIPLRFESAPELISGIELVSNGQKMAWSIADYLTAMEKGISEVLDGKGDADALPPPDPLLEERRGS